MTSEASWHHVKSQENPADCASRVSFRNSTLKEETSSSQQQQASASRYFLDTDGIIKVGGRLKNSSLSPIQKHPILLPKSHHLTNLVIQHFHHINLHSEPQLTLCCIRQKFWIPSDRGVVGRLLSKCQICSRFKAKSGEQLMGN
ncbi:integrase catalytic domain-containing protein [Trichonephila clavipes]|nr:integrase catalytic domain-containing protein [Trichonephila clavipes]